MGSNYRIIPVGGGGGTAPTGTLEITENGTYDVRGYQYVNIDMTNGLLVFQAKENNSTIRINNYNSNTPNIEYSTDKTNWTTWDYSTITLAHTDDKIYMRGYNPTGLSSSISKYSTFAMTGKIAASGDVMVLLDYPAPTSIPNTCCFYKLFEGCSALISAPYISATSKVSTSMYGRECAYMFKDCTGLTSIPKFPAILARATNYSMTFEGMYMGCTGLTGTLDLSYMTQPLDFTCENDGIFRDTNYTHIDLTGLTSITSNYVMKRAFNNMPALESVDMRNVTTLSGDYAMEGAFSQYDYRNNPTMRELIIGVSYVAQPNYTCFNWLQNVSRSGDFYDLGNSNLPSSSQNGVPYGWIRHNSL